MYMDNSVTTVNSVSVLIEIGNCIVAVVVLLKNPLNSTWEVVLNKGGENYANT